MINLCILRLCLGESSNNTINNYTVNSSGEYFYRQPKTCSINNTQCESIVFDDSFTSIVTEVNLYVCLVYSVHFGFYYCNMWTLTTNE